MALTRLTKITGPGIATDTNWVGDNANYTGIVTATKFVGSVEGSIAATDATFSGNVSIAGTLTYEDVTNIDSVGVITARDGIFLPDSKMAKFGNTAADPDLEIYHGGTASYISHTGTGNLFIHSNTVAIRKQNQQAYFVGVNGQSKLYESGNERLVTTTKGITVGTGVTIETNGQANFAGITTVSGTDLIVKPPTVSSSRIKLGYAEQMKISVSSSNQNVIQSTAAYLQIASNNINLSRADTNLHMARFLAGQQCKLTYNYIDRIATSGVGATVYGQFDTTNLNIAGVSTFTGNIDANGDLDVDGHTNLDNVNIAGITSVSSQINIGGGATQLQFINSNDSDINHNESNGSGLRFRINGQTQMVIKTDSITYGTNLHNFYTNRIATHSGDSDTYIRFPANDTISFDTAGSERLRITSSGGISFDQGTTAAITPSQTTATSIGHQTMSGGTAWFNHAIDYFGVDGDYKLTNGATYGKIVARNAAAAISNAEQGGHTWFLVCKTVAGTLGNSNWVVEPVAGWKMAWPVPLGAGAVATFYMRDAVESFGSPTIPASGDYYIGWFYSDSQGRGTNGNSYYVDASTGGKIYYYSNEGDMSNPHQRIPRQGDSWDSTMSGEKIHFRFETLPKADLTGTVFASPLLVDPVMQGVPLIDGLPMAGGQLVKDVQWATNVSSVEFTNADFVNCNYLVTYSINGSDGGNNSTGWYQTRLQFCDHDGSFYTGTNDYISHCEWMSSTSTSPSMNSNFAGYQRSIWLTGNGSDYDHEGYVWIIPSNFRHNRNANISQRWGNGTEYTSLTHPRIFVRGHSFLSTGNQGANYREEGGGTYRGTNGVFNISGFRLYGSNSSDYHTPASNGSSNGYVRIWRFKSGFEAREVS